MLSVPFPYIANTAGWMTAEVGRQPWLVYGLMRTADGSSPIRVGGQRVVHAARIHGPLHAAAILFLFLIVSARSSMGPEPGRREPARASRSA